MPIRPLYSHDAPNDENGEDAPKPDGIAWRPLLRGQRARPVVPANGRVTDTRARNAYRRANVAVRVGDVCTAPADRRAHSRSTELEPHAGEQADGSTK